MKSDQVRIFLVEDQPIIASTLAEIYCEQNGLPYAPFVGDALYDRWKRIVAGKRNRAVQAGVAGFT